MEVDVDAAIGLELATKADIEKLARRETPYRKKTVQGFSGITDATGKVAFRVYDIPDGMRFQLAKFIAWGDAHNPSTGSVYSNAAAWCGLFHGVAAPVNLADFWPYPEAATGQVLPYTKEYSEFQAPEWRVPDNVVFQIVGGPVTENVTILLFGMLEELDQRKERNGRMRQLQRMSRMATPLE